MKLIKIKELYFILFKNANDSKRFPKKVKRARNKSLKRKLILILKLQ